MTNERRSAFGDSSSQVKRVMQRGIEKQEEAKPYAGRGKPGHSGQRGRDSEGRAKLTAVLHPGTADRFRELAEETGIGLSDLAEAALRGFINGYRAGKIDLSAYQVRARSLKAEWSLELPDEITFFLP